MRERSGDAGPELSRVRRGDAIAVVLGAGAVLGHLLWSKKRERREFRENLLLENQILRGRAAQLSRRTTVLEEENEFLRAEDARKEKRIAALLAEDARKDVQIAVLEEASQVEPLTSLYSRQAFIAEFDRKLEQLNNTEHQRREADPKALALLVFDGDRFKEVNDTYGHPNGDELLRTIGDAFHLVRRYEDVASRLGGDEFVMLVSIQDIDNAETIIQGILDRIHERLNALLQKDAHIETAEDPHQRLENYRLTCGWTLIQPGEPADFESAYDVADAQLLRKKRERDQGR